MSNIAEEIAPVKDPAQKRPRRLRERELEQVLYLRVSAQARNLWPPFPRSATSVAGSLRAQPGHAQRAKRGGAPQGTRNFEERSDIEV